ELCLLERIPSGAEACSVLVGELDSLQQPFAAFVRLAQAVLLSGLPQVPIPTRFLFVLLGPAGKGQQYQEVGRSMATLMMDEVFQAVAYKGKGRGDLVAGIDEFLEQVEVSPAGQLDPAIQIQPPVKVPSQEQRKVPGAVDGSPVPSEPGRHAGPELQWTGRLCGGFLQDVKCKAPWFWSDFRDAFSLQCLASFLFLYCASMSPVITFGGLLGEVTEGHMSVMESLLGACLSGVLYSLFAGQPLTILGSTGPVLVFEKIVYQYCSSGPHLLCLLFIPLGFSPASCKCVAPTHPSNETLHFWESSKTNVSAIAWDNLTVTVSAPSHCFLLTQPWARGAFSPCKRQSPLGGDGLPSAGDPPKLLLAPGFLATHSLPLCPASLPLQECRQLLGEFQGAACGRDGPYTPNVFLWCFILLISTFTMANCLKSLKTSHFFNTKVCSRVSDFAVFLTVVVMVLIDFLVGIPSPKLHVPSTLKLTRDDRGWFISPIGPNPWWTVLAALIPALLCTILVFMDQHITVALVNRKDHKLK
ncbi:S4A10 protein, partial [Semnornis frantzii]|nr:S4A10 protein [Semnornis frantzii]